MTPSSWCHLPSSGSGWFWLESVKPCVAEGFAACRRLLGAASRGEDFRLRFSEIGQEDGHQMRLFYYGHRHLYGNY